MVMKILEQRSNTLNRARWPADHEVAIIGLAQSRIVKVEKCYYMIQSLLEQGADPNLTNIHGNALVRALFETPDPEILSIPTLFKKADLFQMNYRGNTPFFSMLSNFAADLKQRATLLSLFFVDSLEFMNHLKTAVLPLCANQLSLTEQIAIAKLNKSNPIKAFLFLYGRNWTGVRETIST